MTGTVFNVYLGSSQEDVHSNTYQVTQLVRQFFQRDEAQEFVDYVCYNGSGAQSRDDLAYPLTPVRAPLADSGELLPGADNNITRSVVSLVKGEVEPGRLLGMVTKKNRSYIPSTRELNLRLLSDDSVEAFKNNLVVGGSQEERDLINQLIDAVHLKKIKHVNLVGSGTGGCNAIHIASALHRILPEVTVNILALDPVLDSQGAALPSVTPNVRAYVSVIAQHDYDEHHVTYIPEVDAPSLTNVQIVTLPGNRAEFMGELTGLESEDDPIVALSARANRFVLQTLVAWSESSLTLKTDLNADKNWSCIAQHRKKNQSSRIVRQESSGHCYLETLPGMRINPSDPLETFLTISHDTCTLHRDYNDHKIADNINDILSSITFSEEPRKQSVYYRVWMYILSRHETRGSDNVLISALEAVQSHLEGDVSALVAAADGRTLLMHAARLGDEALLQAELKKNSGITQRNKNNETALILAAQHGKIGAMNRLLHYFSQNDKVNALLVAAKANQHLAVRGLLACIDMNSPYLLNHPEVRYILKWCVENNNFEVFRTLVVNEPRLLNIGLPYARTLQRSQFLNGAAVYSNERSYIPRPRTCAAVSSVLAMAYSASVLVSSTHAVHYGKFFETVLVAGSLQAPVALVAIVLAAMSAITLLYLANNHVAPALPPCAYSSIDL